MKKNDMRKLQLLLCAALIDTRDTQRRVLDKINYVIEKYTDNRYYEHRKRE